MITSSRAWAVWGLFIAQGCGSPEADDQQALNSPSATVQPTMATGSGPSADLGSPSPADLGPKPSESVPSGTPSMPAAAASTPPGSATSAGTGGSKPAAVPDASGGSPPTSTGPVGVSGAPNGGAGGRLAGGGAEGVGIAGVPAAGSAGASDPGESMVVPTADDPNERHFLLRDEGLSQLSYVDLGNAADNWHVGIPTGRELQLVGNNQVMIGTETGYEERSISDGSLTFALDTFPGTIAAHRLRNGNTILSGADWLGVSGMVLVEIDAAGNEVHRMVFDQFHYVRLVRPTPSGTYLVTSNTTVFETDSDSNILWQVSVEYDEPHSWKALRLPSGETVVSTGYDAAFRFFSPDEQLLRRVGGPSEVSPYFFCDFQILPSGNFLVANWQGHGEGHGDSGRQLVELTPSGSLVWAWQQDPSFVSSLQGVILLDGLDLMKLHVEDTTGELVPVD